MRVLLVNAPMLYVSQLERPPSSTHLHVLYSYLRDAGHEVAVYDPTVALGLPAKAPLGQYLRTIEEHLASLEFDVAGVSAWTSYQYLGSVEVGRMLRRLRPDAITAVGGYHPSILPEDYSSLSPSCPFDYIVCGPGEAFLLDVCEKNPRRPPVPAVVQGTSYSLDTLRMDWSYPYHQAAVFLSRGCPYGCTFCSRRATAYESMSIDRAVSECLRADENAINGLFRIQDPIFALEKSWRAEFLSELTGHRLKARPCLELRADQLGPSDLGALAPLRPLVYFGLDSASPTMLETMRKTSQPRRYLTRFGEVLKACDDHGIDYVVGILLNHPGETPESLEQTLEYCWRLVWDGPSERLLAVFPHAYAYFPGSPVEEIRPGLEAAGAKIHHPAWWRMPQADHRALSEDNIGSAALAPGAIEKAMKRFELANWFLGPRRAALLADVDEATRAWRPS